jgi:exportin-T
MGYVREQCLAERSSGEDLPNVRNKVTQTIAYLFSALYATQWPTFFDDFLALANLENSAGASVIGTLIYIKVLIAVHDEIADVLVSRTPEQQQRDNSLKDLVRERDAQKISRSWEAIILRWKAKDGTVIEQCLSALGRWASWTDPSLIVNTTLLNLLFELATSPTSTQDVQATKLRDASLNTFMEIMAKKMRPTDKLELIAVLKIESVVAQLTSSPPLQELRLTSSYDTDLAELVAKLLNNTVNDIIGVLESLASSDSASPAANSLLKELLPYVLRYFSDEYDEICSSVIPCLTDLLTYFRKKGNGADASYAAMLPPILEAIVAKMKYDETSSWGTEDAQTDEAEFQELRKRLQNLQQAVAAVDEVLYIDTISRIIESSLDRFQTQRGQVDWRDIDLAMHELFLFGELAVKNGGLYAKTKPVSPAAMRLISIMYKVVESGTDGSCLIWVVL